MSFDLDAAAQKYVEIHGNASVDVVKNIMQKTINCHETINEKLGLNHENSYRKLIQVDKSHQDIFNAFKTESALIIYLVEACNGNPDSVDLKAFTAKNSKGQEQKIGRMIDKLMKTECVQELITKLGMNYTKENFIPHFRELIAKQAGIHISTNPFDLLTPSNHCTFSSCHKIAGEYSLSPLYNAACGTTFQAVIFEGDMRKSGRMWCWSDCETYYFNGCSYGTIGTLEKDALKIYLKQNFGLEDNNDSSPYFGYDPSGVYHDGVCDLLTSEDYRQTSVELSYDPICPACGDFFEDDGDGDNHMSGAVCDNCR